MKWEGVKNHDLRNWACFGLLSMSACSKPKAEMEFRSEFQTVEGRVADLEMLKDLIVLIIEVIRRDIGWRYIIKGASLLRTQHSRALQSLERQILPHRFYHTRPYSLMQWFVIECVRMHLV